MRGGYGSLLSTALILSCSLTLASGCSADNSVCNSNATIAFKRKADLPRPVLDLIEKATRMADAGEPFEKTDVVGNPPLPFQRFISAEQHDCNLAINYEQGGRGYSHGVILLRQTGDDWSVRPGSSYPYSRLEHKP
jgi:hypothetical protein